MKLQVPIEKMNIQRNSRRDSRFSLPANSSHHDGYHHLHQVQTSIPFPPRLGGETIDNSEERVVGGFARGSADDDGAAVVKDGGLVIVGLGTCSGVEAELACVVSGEKH